MDPAKHIIIFHCVFNELIYLPTKKKYIPDTSESLTGKTIYTDWQVGRFVCRLFKILPINPISRAQCILKKKPQNDEKFTICNNLVRFTKVGFSNERSLVLL